LEDPCDYTSWSASRWKADLFCRAIERQIAAITARDTA
jgi:hypothetical protein